MRAVLLASLLLAHWNQSLAPVRGENHRADYLQRALPSARDSADVVFLGKVESVRPAWAALRILGIETDDRVTLRIVEVFKGAVSGSVIVDCHPFLLAREPSTGVMLVYARAGRFGAFQAAYESRTRFVEEGDRELTWLRTGELPPKPVALRREVTPGVWAELEELIAVIDCRWEGRVDDVPCELTHGLIPFEGGVPPGPIFTCAFWGAEAGSSGRSRGGLTCRVEPR